ncbi:MAG: DeoR family transcriptional regulator [Verrucomicrobia bacterium]|nr:DeoR family transcriptional regulator [Verrucomicrobiota bacterium]
MNVRLASTSVQSGDVRIRVGDAVLEGILATPAAARGLVLFAHGSGSGRHSTRNRHVAEMLQSHGIATLLFDLLTAPEERRDAGDGRLRFDIDFLTHRLRMATAWAFRHFAGAPPSLGYFGASTGAAAALQAAAAEGERIRAVVSRGGRPDLAADALSKVLAPTLLIVGGDDAPVLELNHEAFDRLRGVKHLAVVSRATHLFEEPGALEAVADLAAAWFGEHLSPEEMPV